MALDIALDNPDALSQRAVGTAPVIVKRLRRHSHSPCEDRHHSYCAHSPVPNGSGSSDCGVARSEEHTSELQSLMRISYAVFFLNKIIFFFLTISLIHFTSLTFFI